MHPALEWARIRSGKQEDDRLMAHPRLWIYNYDFEFELAGEPGPVHRGASFSPWYFLNRSWHAILPLAAANDQILVYDDPLPELLENLGSDPLPGFCRLPAGSESNSVFDDLDRCETAPSRHKPAQLAPWGWSPKAFVFARANGFSFEEGATPELVRHWNSKITSHNAREELLPVSWRIPGTVVHGNALGRYGLRPVILQFVERHNKTWIKHPFGTAGRLSDTCDGSGVSERKIRKWESWLKKCGQILLEQHLAVKQEWSLQVDVNSAGCVSPLGLTRLFSGPAGNYTGTLLADDDQKQTDMLCHSLSPLLEALANSGYKGPAGFDLLETEDGSWRLLEINCRLTMGRTALAWHRRMAGFPVSFFTNLFIPVVGNTAGQSLLDRIRQVSGGGKIRITVLNLILSPTAKEGMISLLIQGGGIDAARSGIAAIKSSLK